MTKSDEWFRRATFPDTAKAALGWGVEYWISDPSVYEGHAELTQRGIELQRSWSVSDVTMELVDNLLSNVLIAAGGVEHAMIAFRACCEAAQLWGDQYRTEPRSDVPLGVANENTIAAWYEFTNVLSWARSLEDRVDRKPYGPITTNQGLVNALRPGLFRTTVEGLLADLRAGPLGESRWLTNVSLHAALIRSPYSGAMLDNESKITLPIPNRISGRVMHPKLLRWSDQRDGRVFAEELWRSVEKFVDSLLEAFEQAVPDRLRRS